VVVSGYDLQGFWTRLQGSRLYQELQAVQGVRDALAPLEESRREIREEICLDVDESTMMSLFGRKFDIGFYGELPGDRADLVLVAELADEDAAETLLEQCEAQLTTEKGATFSETEVGGRSVRVASNSEGEEVLFYSLEDERLALGTTRERLEQTLAIGGDEGIASMTSVQGYTAALRKLPAATVVVYVDQAALRQAAEAVTADTAGAAAAGADRMAAARTALGAYPMADAVVFGMHWEDSGIGGTMYTRFPSGERPELARMLTAAPGEVRSLAYQPEGTLLYGALNTLDARVVYDEVYRYAVEATRVQLGVAGTPDSARADSVVAAGLARTEAELGVDVEDDLVGWVGKEVALAIIGVDKTGFFPVPQVGLTIATTDAARTRQVMGTLETSVSEMALARASIPLQWQSVEHEGQTIRYAPTPMGEGLSLAWTVADQFLLLASSRGVVQRMIDSRAGRAPALPANPEFSAMTGFYPQQANAIGFVNIERILTEVEGLMTTYGQMSGNVGVADSASTGRRVISALKNAPRLGFYSEADGDGVFGHFMLEVR
ncbi:MAG TPA: DUF3352 domain-containing protein, partial [Gemmatimonadota bacterium]|nr:DUF3352 domain-containing protein [Gemmatimonadota bacterium]